MVTINTKARKKYWVIRTTLGGPINGSYWEKLLAEGVAPFGRGRWTQ